jgi:predicted transcriptional regulator of viral defense system
MPPDRFSQYREVVPCAKAHRGPLLTALSHETALVVYGISDVNPAAVRLTVPASARLRGQTPKGIRIHRAALPPEEAAIIEGLPLTAIARTVEDLLRSGCRTDLAEQANRRGLAGRLHFRR